MTYGNLLILSGQRINQREARDHGNGICKWRKLEHGSLPLEELYTTPAGPGAAQDEASSHVSGAQHNGAVKAAFPRVWLQGIRPGGVCDLGVRGSDGAKVSLAPLVMGTRVTPRRSPQTKCCGQPNKARDADRGRGAPRRAHPSRSRWQRARISATPLTADGIVALRQHSGVRAWEMRLAGWQIHPS
jgi:hypothetical protein